MREAWRRCLFAILLAACIANGSADLNDGDPTADSRSGVLTDDDVDNDDSSEFRDNGAADKLVDLYQPEKQDGRKNNGPVDWIDEARNDPIYLMEHREENDPGIMLAASQADLAQSELNHDNWKEHESNDDRIRSLENDHIFQMENDQRYQDQHEIRPSMDTTGYDPSEFRNDELHKSQSYEEWIKSLENDRMYKMENDPNAKGPHLPGPSMYPSRFNPAEFGHHIHHNQEESDQFRHPEVAGGEVIHDQIVFPREPTHENAPVAQDNEYPYSIEKPRFLSSLFKRHKFFTKLIPLEKHILLSKIPGAEDLIKCSREGELHNFWAPGLQCMVCVCLAAYGRLRPVCVSCESCMVPPDPVPMKPTSTIQPPTPPATPPAPPINVPVSCKPLPKDVPFESPLDPCKICICTEEYDIFGNIDVRISCQHNPQCVLPITTPSNDVSTPVPLPICDRYPSYVSFPHPQDKCRTCQCIQQRRPDGRLEKQVICYPNNECKPSTSTTEQPTTEMEIITDLPPIHICDRYPDNVLFRHPTDPCQVCKCTTHMSLFVDKKKITCYVKPECIPHIITTVEPETEAPRTVEPITVEPPSDCKGHPENVPFHHPTDPCMMCKCVKDYSNFIPVTRITCYEIPFCHSTPTPPRTPPPPPDHATCAPLPTDQPFQSPINPCQICICREKADLFGRTRVEINCAENPECIQPSNATTLPPEVVTGLPLPACKNYPENVLFPHPTNHCKECRCYSDTNSEGLLEQRIECYTIPECMSTPVPFTTPIPESMCDRYPLDVLFVDPEDACKLCRCHRQFPLLPPTLVCVVNPDCEITPEPITSEPERDVCEGRPLDVYFQDPDDYCKVCKCHREMFHLKPTVSCFIRPECQPTTEAPEKENATCAPLPHGVPFQHPLNPCQICVCSEARNVYSEIEVLINCKENPQCVLPDDFTTVSPEITNTTVPACKDFPINVYFPHPSYACKLCKCNLVKKSPFFPPELEMSCIVRKECLPPPLSTTTSSPGLHICDRYPENTAFVDPEDECRLCKCRRDPRHPLKNIMTCYMKPECISTPRPPVTTTEPEVIVSCAPLPVGKPFPNPVDPCQTCLCTERADLFGRHDVQIECRRNDQCVTPPDHPTIPPIIVVPIRWPACRNYPLQVWFPHPRDACQHCKCISQTDSIGNEDEYLICSLIPECEDLCDLHRVDEPFDDPADECRVCVCRYPGSGSPAPNPMLLRPELECFTKPDCLLPPPPPPTTEHPDEDECEGHPIGRPFPDPYDSCRLCVCYLGSGANPGSAAPGALGHIAHVKRVKCILIPNCRPTPPPTTHEPETYDICEGHNINEPFPDPHDSCRLCVCHWASGASPDNALPGALEHVMPVKRVNCVLRPECIPTAPPPTTHEPQPSSLCDHQAVNVPFDDPRDPCLTCVCYWGRPGTSPPVGILPIKLYKCTIKPECLPPPTTEEPEDVCEGHPIGQPFPDPYDLCRLCVCYLDSGASPGSAAPGALGHAIPVKRVKCILKPECIPTPPPPTTYEPEPYDVCEGHPIGKPFPDPHDFCRLCVCYLDAGSSPASAAPDTLGHGIPVKRVKCILKPQCNAICDSYPVDVPFTDPYDPCRSCVCTEPGSPGSAPHGAVGHALHGEKSLNCVLKPECQPPTSEPITIAPPTVSCKPLPSGMPFKSPLNPCQICICTETVDVYGKPDVVFRCQSNPDCVVPLDVTTVPPPSNTSPVPLPACAQFPTNVVFPHPKDPCTLCKCTVHETPWSNPEQLINCFPNTDCAVVRTTAAPWPPAPPDPLPGPSPHESCAPYTPNQPFQHPWDECQVCICKEAKTLERITIEVNCFTKPSCCYEPPIDIPGSSVPALPGSAIQNSIIQDSRPHTEGGNSWHSQHGSGTINQIYNWKYATGNGIGVAGSNLYRPGGIHGYDHIGKEQGYDIKGNRWIGAAADGQIRYTNGHHGNLIGPGGNIISLNNGGGIVDSTGHYVVGSAGNLVAQSNGNLVAQTGGNVVGVQGRHLYRPSGQLIGSNVQSAINSNNNLYVHKGSTILRPQVTSHGGWTSAVQYDLTPGRAITHAGDKPRKMRTKSARPSDDDSKDYD